MNGVFELPVEPVPYRQNTSRLSALEQIEDMMDEIAKAELGSLSSSAGVLEAVRDFIYPSPGGGPLEETRGPGGRDKTQREQELHRQVEGDSAQRPLVRAKKSPSALRR